jgi:ectoine hydroxylase-related dioxygenase (phytanoyl-CoA dioxygenase family)
MKSITEETLTEMCYLYNDSVKEIKNEIKYYESQLKLDISKDTNNDDKKLQIEQMVINKIMKNDR